MTPITLTVPDPGCGFINLNQRTHWRAKAKLTKQWRDATAALARQQQVPSFDRVHVLATFHKTTARKYDVSNLAPTIKAALDGLVDAGMTVDDDNAHVIGPDLRAGDPTVKSKTAYLVITITPLEDQ